MDFRTTLGAILALSMMACGGGSAGGDDAGRDAASGDGGGAGGDAGGSCAASTSEVVTFATSDGVTLTADLRVATHGGAPFAAVLLHMIPPSNDRSNYSDSFIDALAGAGVSVLNVDRRGGGDSEGVALEAYEGPNGWLDADAAVRFLEAHACGFDATRVVVVGASNGTTSALDYYLEVDAARRPAGLVFLTPGGYTENQHDIGDNLAQLESTPILWVFSTAERAFSASFTTGAPTSWTFREYDGGDHGTRMFSAVPTSISDVTTWIGERAGR